MPGHPIQKVLRAAGGTACFMLALAASAGAAAAPRPLVLASIAEAQRFSVHGCGREPIERLLGHHVPTRVKYRKVSRWLSGTRASHSRFRFTSRPWTAASS
jgi:hypothetical protein